MPRIEIKKFIINIINKKFSTIYLNTLCKKCKLHICKLFVLIALNLVRFLDFNSYMLQSGHFHYTPLH